MFKKISLFVVPLVAVATFSSPVFAVDQDDCGIWICLPYGFGTGCSGPKSAFESRIRNHKSPLPSMSSCVSLANKEAAAAGIAPLAEDKTASSKDGFAALIASYDYCVKRASGKEDDCLEWATKPERIVKGTSCNIKNEGDNEPLGCVSTLRWVDVFVSGVQQGETYYY